MVRCGCGALTHNPRGVCQHCLGNRGTPDPAVLSEARARVAAANFMKAAGLSVDYDHVRQHDTPLSRAMLAFAEESSPPASDVLSDARELIRDLLWVIDRSHGHRHVETAERARAYLATPPASDAAVPAGEPVAWQYEEQPFSEGRWTTYFTAKMPHTGKFRRNIVPLFAAAPKPASAPKAHAWTGDGNRAADGYDGPICARCGLPDLPSTLEECRA